MIEDYFDIKELVCPHVYEKFKNKAWMFLDSKLLITLLAIRERINKPITVNTDRLTQRGLRCNLCSLVESRTDAGMLYLSPHIFGKAVDFDVKGLTAEEVRLWIAVNKNIWPYPLRLEKGVGWVHLDVIDMGLNQKVYIFEP